MATNLLRHALRPLQRPPALAVHAWAGPGVSALVGALRHDWKGPSLPKGYKHRSDTVRFEHVGGSFYVHSGLKHVAVRPTVQMVDHKFGEFVPTKKYNRPKPKQKDNRKR